MKTKHILLGVVTLVCCVQFGSSLLAHHAATMFDTTKVVEITATVKELQWTNPHVWIQVYVQKAGGSREEWSIEANGPNSLSRQGWRPTSFKPGEIVTLRINPMRDGTPAGLFVGVKFANAATLGRWDPQP